MFWLDRTVTDIETAFAARLAAGDTLRIRDEKTLSGKPHIGSLRSGSMHAFIAEELIRRGHAVQYRYEINDTDAFDAVPHYVPSEWQQYLGKRLCDVPSPSGTHANYAEEMAEGYCRVMRDSGFEVTFYRQSAVYAAGEYDPYIRLALEKKDIICTIYREVSGSQKADDWYPTQVICEHCGNVATTRITGFDGERVTYTCGDIAYAKGCGHTGTCTPFGGRATLPWKVEWAAKWAVQRTDIEAAGKDHYAAGGSRLVSNRIAEEVFGFTHPFGMRHEFILIDGGKMSSSKGVGASAEEVAALIPPYLFRYFLLHKDPMKTLDFAPSGDTIPLLFDAYDAAQKEYYADSTTDAAHAFAAVYPHGVPSKQLTLPKFSLIAFLVQMPHLSLIQEAAAIIQRPLTSLEEAELLLRAEYAKKWLSGTAPERYRFILGDYSATAALDDAERTAIHATAAYLAEHPTATGQDIHAYLHQLKSDTGMEPKKLFSAFYRVLLGRDSGPQLGFLLGALPREQTIATLTRA